MSDRVLFGLTVVVLALSFVIGQDLEDSLSSVIGDLQKTYSAKYQLLDADIVKRQVDPDDNDESVYKDETHFELNQHDFEHRIAKFLSDNTEMEAKNKAQQQTVKRLGQAKGNYNRNHNLFRMELNILKSLLERKLDSRQREYILFKIYIWTTKT